MKTNIINFILITLIILFALIAYLSFWCVARFGYLEFGQIIFHVFLPLKEAPTDWSENIYFPLILLAVNILGILYIWRTLTNKNTSFLILVLMIFVTLDCWYTNKNFHIYDFIKAQNQTSKFIEANYVNPKTQKIIFPKNKKNLIFIMVESLETSYQDKANGGLFDHNYISELTQIAKENISFSHSDKIEGAIVPPACTWTVAGTVAQTASIPLKVYGEGQTIANSMMFYRLFLPNTVALGDILVKNGYHNFAFFNTDASYGGISDYLEQHGDYAIKDVHIIGGISDEKLFQVVKKDLQDISLKTPFSLFIQTIDTHLGEKADFEKTSKVVTDFIKWLQKQPFFDNTVVVVTGDHCNMNPSDFKNLEPFDEHQRKVFNVFINPAIMPKKTSYRKFSTLDIFPTVLAALGADVEGNKLGLGVNLFSDEKTLFEQYGLPVIFSELRKRSPFYDKMLLFSKPRQK